MDFSQFLNVLAKIAAFKLPNLKPEEALFVILMDNMLPLYQNIMKETDIGDEEEKFKKPFEKNISSFVISISCSC